MSMTLTKADCDDLVTALTKVSNAYERRGPSAKDVRFAPQVEEASNWSTSG
jgi:hypothetical protein